MSSMNGSGFAQALTQARKRCDECGESGSPGWVSYSVQTGKDLCRNCYLGPEVMEEVERELDRQERDEEVQNEMRLVRARDLLVDMGAAMRQAEKPIDYPVYPLAARGFLTLLVGRPSSYKTWLTLLGGHAVHAGREGLAGMDCRKTTTLLVDAENGERLIGKRFSDAGIPKDGMLVADGSQLRLPKDVEKLGDLVAATGAGLVILDSLRELAPSMKENDSDSVAPVLTGIRRIARDYNVAVVVIHHRSSKEGAAKIRGSSSFEGSTDLAFTFDRYDGDVCRLKPIKFRIDADPRPFWFRFALDEDLHFAVEKADPVSSHSGDSLGGGSNTRMEDLLAGQIRKLAPAAPTRPDGWAPHQLAAAVGREQNDRSFRSAINMLVESGEWVKEGATKAARYRPADSSHSSIPLGDGSNTRVEELFGEGER